ncbi:ribose-phosphate pyrophosphokinase [Limosilactobacillus reuteri]|jgi:ribose-phosphate pyrophosphokinase|uniref:Putative ribose-phosphate pyrophosphokinase n=3 Tax=Limosilactobacillus reuteri TaxID=1598 RepID=A0A1V4FMC9_LIMRT|nr:ribose-phosphate diphosphokinase [Limosilactobacillus reuteri]CCC03083.1 phosphoribosyl pyrophosphate synthase [Limosilactobacillus reuteri subsp. suis]AGN99510.1 phosphoribosyl pyrophosphate synthase [Limosilactobacillus reuteri I5007]AMY13487.1 ribose-phosphate pyrophosphokinase [Limosilactobacillus reuteri]MCC4340940.1 ribose-phosphate diphosphokinase [Limosilactobacillus reuteri]MCC4345911.1 ribose-phosphate diphosphokinase [Limosilactobacillus reuteri]
MTQIKNADNVRLFSLNSNPKLAEQIAQRVGIPLSKASISHFADGEIKITIDESIRGCEVYVVQSVSDPVNTNLMELLIMVDALRRASAAKINVVMPYYGYARQDRKARSREPITAKLIANLLEMDQISRLVTIDLHAPQVQGFFDIPVDHLQATSLFTKYIEEQNLGDDIVVVAPDHAGVNLARKYAERIKASIAIIDNRNDEVRERTEQEVPEYVIGDVKGKTAIIVDDIVDTGVRMNLSAQALKNFGAAKVYGIATHAVLSADAVNTLQNSPLEKMIVTDTIQLPKEKKFPKLVQLSVDDLLKEAIVRIHNNQSIDTLFNRK